MISASMFAAATTRKLGFWTNFGIMAREAPPRPITPTLKTRSLAAIYSILRGTAAPRTFVFSMTIQARKNCPGLPATPGIDNDKLLLRAGLLIYIRLWFNAFKNVQVVQIDSGFFPTV